MRKTQHMWRQFPFYFQDTDKVQKSSQPLREVNIFTQSSSTYTFPFTHLRSLAAKCSHDGHVSTGGGVAQRRETALGGGVDGGAELEQQSHHIHVAQVGVDAQDGGVVQHLRAVVDICAAQHQQPAHLHNTQTQNEGIKS